MKGAANMRIIDAHLHFCPDEAYFNNIARKAHHENTEKHLMEQYRKYGIVGGVIMGNGSPESARRSYPAPLKYCVGLDNYAMFTWDIKRQLVFMESHLRHPHCVGIKLYPGYDSFYIFEDALSPLYSLAARFHKPVAVHMGLTASNSALLKYSHPLVMDEAATKYRQVQFVMCHFGEPWFVDAAAVVEKNPNVMVDLSGILEGKIPDFEMFLKKKRYYIEHLKGWLEYLDLYDRFMFGTDWPLANLGDYIAFTKEIIPESEWNKVFFSNANRIYRMYQQ